ncbi:sulfotransferase [Croceimicrobium hydrocarbonivorans]|uniref:Sulfotransferase n=1 Tax=Croceimicrobium hydrocarbonivorans TaxID=2761580 RepID=A0A7H0VGD6_9FLAO|nr:sulfotransferase [Croceimicrobium hydrocarbonivorans]QNR24784.1 sulfotransferase [Croceimicrobium hydrocarbonivorans]
MKNLKDLAADRIGAYRKDAQSEGFIQELNSYLKDFEAQLYQKVEEQEHPIFMVIGAPRSGTTLCTQFLANAYQLSYVNNLVARFYLNPLTGIQLSDQVLGRDNLPGFKSEYARTTDLTDIHEFGYYWRYWLKKDSLTAMETIAKDEQNIDWKGLKSSILNMQHLWGNAAVFKNIFGSYHMQKLSEVLPKVVFVHIERNNLDAAESIYKARLNQYGEKGLSKWWSYSPPNVSELLSKNVYEQIAGQVHFLKNYYQQESQKLDKRHFLSLRYEDLLLKPQEEAERIAQHVRKYFDYTLEVNPNLDQNFKRVKKAQQDSSVRQRLTEEFKKLQTQI